MANISKTNSSKSSEKGPCWKGYEQVGMKTKDGNKVPNCVPESKSSGSAAKKKS